MIDGKNKFPLRIERQLCSFYDGYMSILYFLVHHKQIIGTSLEGIDERQRDSSDLALS